jgi:hypothetical protein
MRLPGIRLSTQRRLPRIQTCARTLRGAAAGQLLGMLVMEPGSLIMERKMLLGIKQRAERLTG